jgi:hypothetical protein
MNIGAVAGLTRTVMLPFRDQALAKRRYEHAALESTAGQAINY